MNAKNIIVWIVVIAVVGFAGYYAYKRSSSANTQPADQQAAAQQGQNQQAAAASDQVQGQEVKVGTGKEAKPGTVVTVDYVGKLTDGTVFDSSAGKQPLTFTLGEQGIIPGFQIGVNGMKEGGERLLAVPPALGYGDKQVGTIPPNSTLIFDVKLIKVEEAAATTTAAPVKK